MAGNVIADRLRADMRTAMKEGDKARLGTIRMLLSELKNAQIAEGGELDEEREILVLSSYAKKRRESIGEFEKGGRKDLADNERGELEIVTAYLPEQMDEKEIRDELSGIIEDTGAEGQGDMGRVMGAMMSRFRGRVDGNTVKRIAAELLGPARD